MTFRPAVAAVALLLSAAPAAHAQPFEGVVRQRIISAPLSAIASLTGGGERPDAERVFAVPVDQLLELPRGTAPGSVQVMEIQLYVQGSRVRIEMSMPELPTPPGMYSILDHDARMVHAVMPSMRMVMSMSLADGSQVEDAMRAAATLGAQLGGDDPQVTPLPARTMHGLAAEGFEIRGANLHARVWSAPELERLLPRDIPGLPTPPVRPPGLAEYAGQPVLMQMVTWEPAAVAAGTGGNTMMPPSYMITEVLSIERGPVDAALFEVPADYRRVTAPGG